MLITPEGKLDFHAAKTAFTTFVLESAATVKEAQVLARHSTPDLTMNSYGRTRQERLIEVTEKVEEVLNGGENHANRMLEET